jgi:hypothetical protein
MRTGLFAFFLVFLNAIQSQAQSTVALRLDSAFIETGEAFTLTVEVPQVPDTLDLSAWNTAIAPENLLDQTNWQQNGGRWTKQLRLILFEATDSLVLPPMTVILRDGTRLASDSLQLTVIATPVPSEEISDLADIKDIHREEGNWTDYIWLLWIVGGLVVLGLVLYWLSKRRKQKNVSYRSSSLYGTELARRRLDQLEAQQLWQKGDTKGYYATLSAIMRQFLDEQYQLATQKSGAEDAIRQLPNTPLNDDLRSKLTLLLRNADVAKYAKGKPEPEYHPVAMTVAREIVEANS